MLLADVLLHYAVPVLYLVFWWFALPKASLRWVDPLVWSAYPAAYCAYALARGALIGSYPYPTHTRSTILHLTLFALAIGCILPASAQPFVFKNGSDLHGSLQQDGREYSYALNYIVGVVDAANGTATKGGFCFDLKGEIGGSQIADVVKAFLVKNPQIWDRTGSTLVAAALEEVWPCTTPASTRK